MACPKCGCKETYEYVEDDVLGFPDDQERCAACGHIFFFEDGTEEEDDDDMTPNAEHDRRTAALSPGVRVDGPVGHRSEE